MKSLPLPVSFLVVLAVTIALVIFFGAWAVSADVDERDRVFAFAVPGGAANFPEIASDTTRVLGRTEPGLPTEGQSYSDTWWGSSLLKACPLH